MRITPTLRAFLTGRRGNAVVEFALIAPFLMMFALGAADFGRVFLLSQRVSAAVKEAAFYAMAKPAASGSELQAVVTSALSGTAIAATLTVSAVPYEECGGCAMVDRFVTITASSPVTLFFTYPGFGDTVNISYTTDARVG